MYYLNRAGAKAIKKDAHLQLKENISRAMAVLCISLFIATLFLMINQLVMSILGRLTGSAVTQFSSWESFYMHYTSSSMKIVYVAAVVVAFFDFLLVSPLNLGICKWYFLMATRGSLQVGNVYSYYKGNDKYTGAVAFELNRLIRLAVFFVISFLPSAFCIGWAFKIARSGAVLEDENAKRMLIIGIALAFVGIAAYIFLSLRYFLARYIYVSGLSKSVAGCFSKSAKMMKGNKGRVVEMAASLIGWYLLCLFIFPVAYVIPLHSACMANCARAFISESQTNEEQQ